MYCNITIVGGKYCNTTLFNYRNEIYEINKETLHI